MITTEHIENVYGRISDAHGIPVQSEERRAEFRRWLTSEIERVKGRSRAEFADELTRKGVYSFDIHSIRRYASEDHREQ